jgi:hypothetical protein
MLHAATSYSAVTSGIAAILLCTLLNLVLPVDAHAQELDDRLQIGGIEHSVVDNQHVILARLVTTSSDAMTASGLLAVVDAGGIEVLRVSIETGPLVPDGSSVLAVPLPEPLQPGQYRVSLVLSVQPDGSQIDSGPRQIIVPDPASGTVPPAESGQQAPTERGFPSWLLLAAGVLLVGFGFAVQQGAVGTRRRRRVPDVAMVRRVKLAERPARRPATIKPLLPPGKRGDSRRPGESTDTVRVGNDDL